MKTPNIKKYSCKICGKKYKYANTLTRHLNKEHKDISLRKYYLEYLTNEDGKCKICGNSVELISFSGGFYNTCSKKCENKYKYERTKQSLIDKYGVTNPSQLSDHQDKVKKTNLKNHGVEHWVNPEKNKETCLKNCGRISHTGTKDYNKKYKKTCLEKYGVEHHTQSKEVKETNKQTCLEKYGKEYILQVPEIRKKIEKTVIKKYGGFTLASKELRKKFKKTMINRYGTEYGLQNKKIRQKVEATCLERYQTKCVLQDKSYNKKLFGVGDINQIPEVKEKQKTNRIKTLKKRYGVNNSFQIPEIKKTVREKSLREHGVEHWVNPEKNKKTCLKKYGVENVSQIPTIKNKIVKTHFERYGEYSKFMPHFSLSSQRLFDILSILLQKKIGRSIKLYYATNNGNKKTNEFKVLTNKSIKYLDFYVPILNKWIEFDESWHKQTAEKDRRRTNSIKNSIPSIELLRIWEQDFLKNEQAVINKCMKFLLNE